MNFNIEYFWPERTVIIYATSCVGILLLTYAMRLLRVNWNGSGMHAPLGNGVVQQVDATRGANEMVVGVVNNFNNNVTPAAGMGFILIFVWIITAVLGIGVIPAALKAMSQPSTLNVLLLMLAAISLAFAMARLTLTAIFIGIKLTIYGVMIAIPLAILGFVGIFISGGNQELRMNIWDRVSRSVASYRGLEDELGARVNLYSEFNICVMIYSVQNFGDMRATLDRCLHLAPPLLLRDGTTYLKRLYEDDLLSTARRECARLDQQVKIIRGVTKENTGYSNIIFTCGRERK